MLCVWKKNFFTVKCLEKFKATISLSFSSSFYCKPCIIPIAPTSTHPPPLPTYTHTNTSRRGWLIFPCALIFHIEWRTCNSLPGLNCKLFLLKWFHPFPQKSYFLFPSGSADSSNLSTSAINVSYIPESSLAPCCSQAPNFWSQIVSHQETTEQNKMGPGIGNPVSRALEMSKSTAVFSCCYGTGDPGELPAWKLTDTDQRALVAMVRKNLSMLSPYPLVPGMSGAQSWKRVLKALIKSLTFRQEFNCARLSEGNASLKRLSQGGEMLDPSETWKTKY